MKRTLTSLALAGSLLGSAGVGAVLAGGGLALAQDATPSATAPATASADERTAARTAELREALAGLVADGSITAEQADEVAATLAATWKGGRGGHGHGPGGRGGARVAPETVAGIVGVTVEELRASHESGQTLAQLAESKGVSRADLVARLVEAGKAELATAVSEGRLTQAQADERAAELTERVEAQVDRVHGQRR